MSLLGIYLEFVGMRANLLVPNALRPLLKPILSARCYLLTDTGGNNWEDLRVPSIIVRQVQHLDNLRRQIVTAEISCRTYFRHR